MIRTFIDCHYRKEEIERNDAYRLTSIGITCDPGLLDWSACTHPDVDGRLCDENLRCSVCPRGFQK